MNPCSTTRDMSKGIVGFRLDGEVTIGKLSEVCARFTRVLQALDESHDAGVRWVLAGLEHGSAAVTARATPLNRQAEQAIPAMTEELLQAALRVAGGNTHSDRAIVGRIRELAEVADEKNGIVLEAAGEQVAFTAFTWSASAERQAKHNLSRHCAGTGRDALPPQGSALHSL